MLRSLEIQNFKGIREGKVEDLAQVNVLVGRNNSGKSTILDALIMLRCAVAGRDYLGTDGLDQIAERLVNPPLSLRETSAYAHLWFMSNTRASIVLAAEFANGAKFLEEWDRGLSVTARWGSSVWRSVRNTHTPSWAQTDPKWDDLRRYLGPEGEAYLTTTHILDPGGIRRPFAQRDSAFILDARDTKVAQMLNGIYGTNIKHLRFESFGEFRNQDRLVAALPHAGLPVDWLGDGMRYAVNILALSVLLKGTALLVEELETHQHPESLRKLTQTLFELAKQQDLQLFLTTHSMELITYCLDVAEEKGIDLKLHHLSLNKEGTLRVTSMSQPSAQLLLDIGHDPRLHYKYIGVE